MYVHGLSAASRLPTPPPPRLASACVVVAPVLWCSGAHRGLRAGCPGSLCTISPLGFGTGPLLPGAVLCAGSHVQLGPLQCRVVGCSMWGAGGQSPPPAPPPKVIGPPKPKPWTAVVSMAVVLVFQGNWAAVISGHTGCSAPQWPSMANGAEMHAAPT